MSMKIFTNKTELSVGDCDDTVIKLFVIKTL